MINMTNNSRSLMILYSDSTSPLGHAVRIVLAEKDVNVQINYIDPDHKPDALREINPYNTSLMMIDRDLVLYDPEIIMEYLDERFPHPPLMPVDPVNRANNRQVRYRIMRDLYATVDLFANDDETIVADAKTALRDHLTAIVPAFSQIPYFMSEEYSLIDCCMAPLLWRLAHYGIKIPVATKPLQQYAARLFERAAFKTSLSALEKEYQKINAF